MEEIKCKCGATTLAGHTIKVEEGYPGHVFQGLFSDWATPWTSEGIEDPEHYCDVIECPRPFGHAGFCDNEPIDEPV